MSDSRRTFLKKSTVASSFFIVPRVVLGGPGFKAPSDTLVLAGVGIAGMGRVYLQNCKSENIAVLCDVDHKMANHTIVEYPDANLYTDYRRMLDAEPGIDGVVIGTPDHTHAVITMESLRRGKHVYCAKPLTRTIHESRMVTNAAREAGVATQMSTQAQAEEGPRRSREWVQSGAIGDVSEVHIWTNRPIWPQGIKTPTTTEDPQHIDWDLWLGPAKYRPYNSAYHPFKFRGWIDFGTGALGDMGCHGFDPIFRTLDLSAPTEISASSTRKYKDTYPLASKINYKFPKRGKKPAVEMTWYDGGILPDRPEELREDEMLKTEGILYVGSKGKMLCGFTSEDPRLLPDSKMESYTPPKPSIAPSIGHYKEWIEACKGGEPAPCNFDWGGPLTEIVLLGNVAVQTGKQLLWDAKKGEFLDAEANEYLHYDYREGWSL